MPSLSLNRCKKNYKYGAHMKKNLAHFFFNDKDKDSSFLINNIRLL